jgi:hypothetical protein
MSGIIAQNTLDNTGLIKAPEGGGAWTFISKATASDDSTVSFTSGIDSTYKEYMFLFINLHHSALSQTGVQFNAAGGSGFNETITSTYFQTYIDEGDTAAALEYTAGQDLAQAATEIYLNGTIDVVSGGDPSMSGWLHLYDPSNTTFVKHYQARTHTYGNGSYASTGYASGYINTTSAIDEVQFNTPAEGVIASGDFILYGLTT